MAPRSHARPTATVVIATVAALLTAGLPTGMVFAQTTTPGGEPSAPSPSAEAPVPAEPVADELTRPDPVAAALDVPGLNVVVSVSADGTATWDADSAAGNDSGPNNGIVRVNDTVTYSVQYNVTNADATNVTWRMTFPKGMEILAVPGFCSGPGSQITPATAGTPALPLSATSINELSQQTLVCNMGDVDAATAPVSNTVFVSARVLSLAHQAQDLAIVSADITADGVGAPITATGLPTVKASSRLKWDISKNGIALAEDTGYFFGPSTIACPWDTTVVCKRSAYQALFFAPAGGKGAMPAVGDVTFVDDLSPSEMYPSLSAAQILVIESDLNKYGSRISSSCVGAYYSAPGPNAAMGTVDGVPATVANSVRNSGTCTTAQSGPGQPVTITVTNADMSLRTYPTAVSRPVGTALPSGQAYAISHTFTVFTPIAVIRDFGTENNGSYTLPTRNDYTELNINGFTPTDHQASADQPQWNDYRTSTPNLAFEPGASKSFAGVAGAEGNTPRAMFNPGFAAWEGPAGGNTLGSGSITVAPTQNVTSILQFTGSTSSLPGSVSFLGCDSWDNSKLHLRAADIPSSSTGAFGQFVPSNGEAVWVSGYNNVPDTPLLTRYAHTVDEVPVIEVQYSATPGSGPGAGSTCGEDTGPWFDSPNLVPGNDPTLAQDGIFTAVGRVRVGIVLPEPEAVTMQDQGPVRAIVSISMQLADSDAPSGTIVPNWFASKAVKFSSLTTAEMVAHSNAWSPSTYIPSTHSGIPRGDRLILAPAFVRIDKQVRFGDSGSFSDSPPQVTGGNMVQYRLAPSLSSGALTPGILKEVWIEDCLPGSQAFSQATVTPSLVLPGATPSDAKRPACPTGATYIRWVLPDQEVNKVIEPIILTADVSPTATDGVYTNTVVAWAEDDVSTLAQRTNTAPVQIANVAGIKLEKIALTPQVQVNRPEATTDELNKWSIMMSNTLPASQQSTVSDPDIIDVLPKQGVSGTVFTGTIEFVGATVTEGGPTVRILFTSAATVNEDPTDASNGAAGATTWCDAPAGGAVVSGTGACPGSAAQVTGLRVQRPGAYNPGDRVGIELVMRGKGNSAGDVYVNRAFARASGLQFPVGPILRPQRVVASAVGNYVWWDHNRDGEQNDFRGTAEPGARGVLVRLVGTDDLGNPVDVTTTTAEGGPHGDGWYSFPGLRSSNSSGYTITFAKPVSASAFTIPKAEGMEPVSDSDADLESGSSEPVVIGASASDLTIDAGLIANGALLINKALEGAGVAPFGRDDSLDFEVTCTFLDEPILDESGDPLFDGVEVTLDVDGGVAVTSDKMGPIPAFAECTVTEVVAGDADEPAAPVTVSVPWNSETQTATTAIASVTNRYSAGQISIAKVLQGDSARLDQVKGRSFEVMVVCDIEELTEQGESTVTLHAEIISIKGGETIVVTDAEGNPLILPLGARCYGTEVNTGGADKAAVDFDKPDNATSVVAGTPGDLQQLTVTATNTFRCTEQLCGSVPFAGPTFAGLAFTGGAIASTAVLGAIVLMLTGLSIYLVRRRRSAHQ